MKKITFYVSLLLAIALLINIAEIIINDVNRLTEYGFGYLIGKSILLLIFLIIIILTRKKRSLQN